MLNLTIAVLWFLALLSMLFYFIFLRKRLAVVKNWLATPGKIEEFNWTKRDNVLWANIKYRYQVGDISYSGSRLFLANHFYTPRSSRLRKALYQLAMAYDKDSDITVYYNPLDAQEAVLMTSLPPKLDLIIGLLFFFSSVHLVFTVYHLVG